MKEEIKIIKKTTHKYEGWKLEALKEEINKRLEEQAASGKSLTPEPPGSNAFHKDNCDFEKEQTVGLFTSHYAIVTADSKHPIVGTYGMDTCVTVTLYNQTQKIAAMAHFFSSTELPILTTILKKIQIKDSDQVIGYLTGGNIKHEFSLITALLADDFLKEAGISVLRKQIGVSPILRVSGYKGCPAIAIDSRNGKIYTELKSSTYYTFNRPELVKKIITDDLNLYVKLRNHLLDFVKSYSVTKESDGEESVVYINVNSSQEIFLNRLQAAIEHLNQNRYYPNLANILYKVAHEELKKSNTPKCIVFSTEDHFTKNLKKTIKQFCDEIQKNDKEFTIDKLSPEKTVLPKIIADNETGYFESNIEELLTLFYGLLEEEDSNQKDSCSIDF